MATKKYHGVPYHVWNQATDMDDFMSIFGVGPEVIVRGEGPYLFNQRGTRFINGNAGVWNVTGGLGREKLVEAANRQMRELAFSGCWRMVHPPAIQLAARLVEITGGRYQWVMFGSNGSDAVEAALKLARQYHRQSPDPADRGRYKIFSLRGSYHGFSYGCLSTSGDPRDAEKFGPLIPGYVAVEPPYCYRCPFGKESSGCGLACAQALEDAIVAEGPETAAAFILEPIMGDGNILSGPDEYYTRIGEICRRYGLLMIADEVTTGFGRTGKLFATQDWNPAPDVLCLGKAITNGYFPLSAALVTEAVYERFRGSANYFAHGVTHGGHPVGCAVSLAAIDIILEENLAENSARMGQRMKAGLDALAACRPTIGDVRGRGLMLGVEFVKERATKTPLPTGEVASMFMDIVALGLVISNRGNTLRLMPPLILDEHLVDEIVHILERGTDPRMFVKLRNKGRLLNEYAASKIRP